MPLYPRLGTYHNLLAKGCEGYDFLEVLDSGSIGSVYRARKKDTDKEYAVKVINVTHLNARTIGGSYEDSVRKEIEIHQTLHHPNIVELHEWKRARLSIGSYHEIIYYIILEYVRGGNLVDFVNTYYTSTFPPEVQVREYFKQLLSAIEYCHSQKIVHRDIKMENILITSDHQQLKLADFGLSRFYDQKLCQTFCGSALYAAPEIYMEEPYHGPTVDVWSLGIVLACLALGYNPLGRVDQPKIVAFRLIVDDIQLPDTISRNLQRLLKDMLCKDPSSRISTRKIWERSWLTKSPEKWCTHERCRNCRHRSSSYIMDRLPPIPEDLSSSASTSSACHRRKKKKKRKLKPISRRRRSRQKPRRHSTPPLSSSPSATPIIRLKLSDIDRDSDFGKNSPVDSCSSSERKGIVKKSSLRES